MIYTFILEQCNDLPTSVCCRTMGVSTSSVYAYKEQPVSARDWADAALTNIIFDIHRASRSSYGSPRCGSNYGWVTGSCAALANGWSG